MGNDAVEQNTPLREAWEKEIFAQHRWGQHGEKATEEHGRISKLAESAQPLDESCRIIMDNIIALEICNWNLEESIMILCNAIGTKEPPNLPIGHMNWISEERWKRIWAYYLTCRDWLAGAQTSGYQALLSMCDPGKMVQNYVLGLLGDKDELKGLYIERFCLCLEFWIGKCRGEVDVAHLRESAETKAHGAAVAAVEQEIKKRDSESRILNAFQWEGDGKIPPCHHKLFRRYDIILSSIGNGKWRAAMPMRGTDGFGRAATLENFLSPIEAWINAPCKTEKHSGNELFDKIHTLLGDPDAAKLFLASLLVSLLRSQQLTARKLAESRMKKS